MTKYEADKLARLVETVHPALTVTTWQWAGGPDSDDCWAVTITHRSIPERNIHISTTPDDWRPRENR